MLPAPFRRGFGLSLTLALSLIVATSAEDLGWPHPRGHKLDGSSRWQAMAIPFPSAGPPMLWQRGIGIGYSGAVASQGRLVTQVQTQAGESAICLDLRTGELIWQTIYGPPDTIADVYPGPYATPSCTDKRVFLAGATGLICCLDMADGKIVWKTSLAAKKVRMPGFGYAITPLLHGDRVFLPAGGEGTSMFALDAGDGSVIWQTGDESPTYASAIAIAVDGKPQIVAFYEYASVGYDPATGDVLWRDVLPSNYNPQAAWPVFRDPYLVRAQTFLRGSRVLRLEGSSPVPKVQWEKRNMSNDIASTVIVGDYLYGFDSHEDQPRIDGRSKGEFKCIELATGKEKWRSERTGLSSVIACGEKLLLLTERGELIVIKASPDGYQEIARAQLVEGELCWAPPALADGYLVLRGDRRISCFYLGDPKAVSDRVSFLDRFSQAARHWRRSILRPIRGQSLSSPRTSDFLLWFSVCMILVIVVAAVHARSRGPLRWSMVTAALLGLLSFVGMPLISSLAGRLVFTWPLSVWCCFVAVMNLWLEAGQAPPSLVCRLQARVAMLCLIALAAFYLGVCRFLGIGMGYGFLVGIPAAWFVLWLFAAKRSAGWTILAHTAGFAAYFWGSALFIIWRTA